eukprot:PITA_27826
MGRCTCIDYLALNKKTLKNRYPIAHIDEMMGELRGAKYFSKIDLRSGYHQIRLSDQDIPKMTFRGHYGHFEFLPDWEEYLQHLEVVLRILEEQQFYAKLSKCKFGLTKMLYLGHIIGEDGVRVHEEKIRAIWDWLVPQNETELRGFVGICAY